MKKLLLIAAIAFACTTLTAKPSKANRAAIYASIECDAFPAPQERGDIIPDFSRVGYHYGDKEIPSIKVVKTLTPPKGGADATKMIQAAIDEVKSGAILLSEGTYNVSKSIVVNKSGIVLRGVGSEEGKPMTTIVATGKVKYNLLNIKGTKKRTIDSLSTVHITDDYVPCGQFYVTVDDASGFKIGDDVIITRPSTKEWINDLKMNQIPLRPNSLKLRTKQWQPGGYNVVSERVVTLIDGNTLHFENPIVMSLDAKYGGGTISKYSCANRIKECGVEDIYFESRYNKEIEDDEEHGWQAIVIDAAQHCWVRNVRSKYFGRGLVTANGLAKNITVTDCVCEQPISIITGGRRYSFDIQRSSLCLFKNCVSDNARHDFVTGALGCGPNVFLNGVATNTHSDIGPHHRWNTGTLYDCIVTDGIINVQDRGWMGSGHGWAGANQVFWNCEAAKGFTIQSPWVSAYNYSVGNIGDKREGAFTEPSRPNGVWVSHNKHVEPASLYEAQLERRRKVQPGGVMDIK